MDVGKLPNYVILSCVHDCFSLARVFSNFCSSHVGNFRMIPYGLLKLWPLIFPIWFNFSLAWHCRFHLPTLLPWGISSFLQFWWIDKTLTNFISFWKLLILVIRLPTNKKKDKGFGNWHTCRTTSHSLIITVILLKMITMRERERERESHREIKHLSRFNNKNRTLP